MTNSNLQRIIVLCVLIGVVVLAGLWATKAATRNQETKIDPSPLELEPGTNGVDVPDMPVPEPGDTPPPTEDTPVSPLPKPTPVSEDGCYNDGSWYPEGTQRTSLTNPDGTTMDIADAYYLCTEGKWKVVGTYPPEPVACTADAKMCPDGSFVGRTGPNCEFASCPDETPMTVTYCTDEMRSALFCTQEFRPVCGLVEVQCITTPCDPIPQTFSNGCVACAQGNVSSYTAGACE